MLFSDFMTCVFELHGIGMPPYMASDSEKFNIKNSC